jgi:hypothetical protein
MNALSFEDAVQKLLKVPIDECQEVRNALCPPAPLTDNCITRVHLGGEYVHFYHEMPSNSVISFKVSTLMLVKIYPGLQRV